MAEIEKISVALTSEQVNNLKAAVQTGEYATTSEIIREALRDWQWKREARIEDIDRLRELWRSGKASGKPAVLDSSRTRARARQALKTASRNIA